MSHLTSKTKEVYVPVIYNKMGSKVIELSECDTEEFAVSLASEYISERVKVEGVYYEAVIKKMVMPIYE